MSPEYIPGYRWRVGDVFESGESRWRVERIEGDKAVLRSCGSSWATTIPLTFNEWHEGGRWQLVPAPVAAGKETGQ